MSRRLKPLPRTRRDPSTLKQIIDRKRAQRQNTASESRELVLIVARQIRLAVKQERKAS